MHMRAGAEMDIGAAVDGLDEDLAHGDKECRDTVEEELQTELDSRLEKLLMPQALAKGDFITSFSQSSSPTQVIWSRNVKDAADGFVLVRGMQLSIKTTLSDDKVLVLANVPTSSSVQHTGVVWAFKRGGKRIGPQFKSWASTLMLTETILMPWLDEPGHGTRSRLDVEYGVFARTKAMVQVSPQKEQRQLCALLIPSGQVTSAGGADEQVIEPGSWQPVTGLAQVTNPNEGEKILILCTINYKALWSSEYTRGRFTITRDSDCLDPDSYGLQSVRSTFAGFAEAPSRTLVMALVDDPPAGPHLYAVRAGVTTSETDPHGVLNLEPDQENLSRQLTLLRLPSSSVVGPQRCQGVTTVDDDRWTQVLGLELTAVVINSWDKVLITYHVNFCPRDVDYEVYFTIFRTSSKGLMKNLGHDDSGMWSVASDYKCSSEYPHTMFVDTPGKGSFTYSVCARSKRCNHLLQSPPVDIGPDGQISVVLIERTDQKV